MKEILHRQKCEKEKVDNGDERRRHKPYNMVKAIKFKTTFLMHIPNIIYIYNVWWADV